MRLARSHVLHPLARAAALLVAIAASLALTLAQDDGDGNGDKPRPKFPQKTQHWTTDEFRNAFNQATKKDVTDALGPPDDASERRFMYRGMKIHDTDDSEVVYTTVVLIFTEIEPMRVQDFRFRE